MALANLRRHKSTLRYLKNQNLEQSKATKTATNETKEGDDDDRLIFLMKGDVELQFDLVITINDLDFYLSRQTTLLPQCTIVIDKKINILKKNLLKVKTNTGTVDVFASITEIT